MIVSITDFMDHLTEYFEKSFEDYKGLSYKCSNDPLSGDNTSQPFIYEYLMPSADLIDGYPNKSPCVVLCVDGMESNNTYKCSVHLCVRYDAVSDNEMVQKVPDKDNVYTYNEGASYNTNSDIELYKSALHFVNHAHQLLCNYTDHTLEDITVELPDPTLPDFPYSVAVITFSVKLNHFNIGTNPYNELY